MVGEARRGDNVRAAGLSQRVFETPLSNVFQGGRAGWRTQDDPGMAILIHFFSCLICWNAKGQVLIGFGIENLSWLF